MSDAVFDGDLFDRGLAIKQKGPLRDVFGSVAIGERQRQRALAFLESGDIQPSAFLRELRVFNRSQARGGIDRNALDFNFASFNLEHTSIGDRNRSDIIQHVEIPQCMAADRETSRMEIT